MNKKIVVIVGPTASGKSALAISLAKSLNGEVISADSRQVYRGLDIGSGKITKREMMGIPHHLLDVTNPKRTYTASQYKHDAQKALGQIAKKRKTPIVVGGTGLYIDALLGNIQIPEVKPCGKLRRQLVIKTTAELFVILQKLDPKRSKTIDKHNPRRLIRAIEIAKSLGHVPPIDKRRSLLSIGNVLWVGLTLPEKELRLNIHKRLVKRLKTGMVKEVKKLRKSLSWKRLESFGLEYRYVAQYLQGKITKEEMVRRIEVESWRYAKRQMTWFKRNKKIKWFSPKPKDERKILQTTRRFLSLSR